MCRTRKAFPEVLQNISSFQDKVRKSDPAKANASARMNLAGVNPRHFVTCARAPEGLGYSEMFS